MIPIFDGHNDTLHVLLRPKEGQERDFFERSEHGHIDLPRAREGGLAGGMFAIWTPNTDPDGPDLGSSAPYRRPLPTPVPLEHAQREAMRMIALLYRLERRSEGALEVVRDADALERCISEGRMAAVFHIEGAEPIDPDLDALEVFHAAGLRSLGPVWSRSTAFGHGVPFAFPESPDTGPGLTDAGRELIRACNRLGIMIDLSHLNEAGFWDVAKLSDAPLVATHSNVHAICPSTRNLTDRQLDAIRESGGMVGVNFAVAFLDPSGGRDTALPLEVMVRHFDALVERLGIDGVGFGSDFDGATIPSAIGDASGLQRLVEALRAHGYDDAALRKIGFENWLRVLRRTWKA